MGSSANKEANELLEKQRKTRIWLIAIVCLAATVTFVTVAMLRYIGRAMTNDAELTCGIEEHTHSVDAGCYSSEPDADGNPILTLTCEKEEHSHAEVCYADLGGSASTENTESEATAEYNETVAAIQKRFEALPELEVYKSMTIEEQAAVDEELTSLDTEYYQLTVGQRGLIDTAKAISIRDYQNSLIQLASVDETENKTAENTIQSASEAEKTTTAASAATDTTTAATDTASAAATVTPSSETTASAATETGTLASTETKPAKSKARMAVSDDLAEYITNVSGGGTVYDETTKLLKTTDLTINFKVSKDVVTDCSRIMNYTYPEGVIIPDSLLNQSYDLKVNGGAQIGGKYVYSKNDDGTYKVTIEFDEEFVESIDGDIDGYVMFSGYMDERATDEHGNVKLTFSDQCELTVEGQNLGYPENETLYYDITTTKSGSYKVSEDVLEYTVKVASAKGTPDTISFTDVLYTNGLDIEKLESVTVAKGEYYYSNEWWTDWKDPETASELDQNSYKLEKNANSATLSMELPKLEENSYYLITYRYKLANVKSGKTYKPSNKISAESRDEEKGQIVKHSTEITLDVKKEYKVNKTGKYDSANGKIDWVITINENNLNIAGGKITDAMFENISDKDLTIEPDTGYTILKDGDKIVGIEFSAVDGDINANKYTIKYSTAAEAKFEKQTIRNEVSFDGNGDGSYDSTSGYSVYIPGATLSKEFKNVEFNEDGTLAEVTWNVEITAPSTGIAEGITINDETYPKYGNSSYRSGEEHYMTKAQILEWGGRLTWSDGSTYVDAESGDIELTFTATDGNTYAYEAIKSDNDGKLDDVKFDAWQIVTKKLITPPQGYNKLNITYKTTADTEKALGGENYFYNITYSGNVYDDAYYKYYKNYVVKKGNGSENTNSISNKDGSLVWTVEMFVGDSDSYKEFNVTDTLPENIVLKSLAIKAENSYGDYFSLDIDNNENISGSGNNLTVEGKYDKDLRTVSTNIKLKNDAEFNAGTKITLTYSCEVAEDILYEAADSDKVYEFTNNVKVSSDKGDFGSDDQTQQWSHESDKITHKTLDKHSDYNEGTSELEYTVVINPDGKVLLDGTTPLTLTDTVEYNTADDDVALRTVSLVPGSLQLYKAVVAADGSYTTGAKVSDWSWTIEEKENGTYSKTYWEFAGTDKDGNYYGGANVPYTYTGMQSIITAVIPDGQALILKYKYSVYTELQEQRCEDNYDWLKNRTAKLGVKNTAALEGETYTSTSDNTQTAYKDAQTSGSVSGRRSYTFYKVESGNYQTMLPNAVFSVYEADSSSTLNTYTTNSGGVFTIRWTDGEYQENTLYYVTEIKAPAGYKLPDTQEKYYFYFADSDMEESIDIPDGVKAVNLKNVGATTYVENEKIESTEINVTKKWLDAYGNEAINTPDKISFVLYRTTTSSLSIIGNPEESDLCSVIGSYTITASGAEKVTGEYDIESTGSWSAAIKGLPVIDDKNNIYYYWVVETELPGYEASYSYEADSRPIQSGTITITNKPYMKYSLPETGSVGTLPIYLIGAAILFAAGLFDIKLKKVTCVTKSTKAAKKGNKKT